MRALSRITRVGITAVISVVMTLSLFPASSAADPIWDVCLKGHVENEGWQEFNCQTTSGGASAFAGSIEQARHLEAVYIMFPGGGLCARGYVQNRGWQAWTCAIANTGLTVGTTGQNRALRAIEISSFSMDYGEMCAAVHERNLGWSDYTCKNTGTIRVGSLDQPSELEALEMFVY